MSLATLFRGGLARVPAGQRHAATLADATGATAEGTALEGILRDEDRRFVADGTSQAGDWAVVLLAAGLAFAPTNGMTLTIGGVIRRVVDVGVMEPTDAGTPIAYRVVLTQWGPQR
ncbi:MAG: hypothetical protein AB7G23_19250 [Vicinamibacterales bacterium]